MSHPTCCSVSLDRCDRCDLLVDLESFHLMSVARTPDALVLDVESCNQLVGCPGCGVIAQGHGRMVVEVIDAPWAGVPVRIRWHKRRWICREHACQIATFIEQNHSVCAPRARLGTRAIRWAIRQLRFEGATIAGLARQPHPVNPSIATISIRLRHLSGREASQVLKTRLERPGTMSKSREGPLRSRMGVKSKMTVTNLSP